MHNQPKSIVTIIVYNRHRSHYIVLHLITLSAANIAKTITTMKLEDIDKLFKEQQGQLNQMPPGEVWNKLEQRLHQEPPQYNTPAQKRLIPRFRWAVAASFLLFVAASVLMYLYINQPQDQNQPLAVVTQIEESAPPSTEDLARGVPENLADEKLITPSITEATPTLKKSAQYNPNAKFSDSQPAATTPASRLASSPASVPATTATTAKQSAFNNESQNNTVFSRYYLNLPATDIAATAGAADVAAEQQRPPAAKSAPMQQTTVSERANKTNAPAKAKARNEDAKPNAASSSTVPTTPIGLAQITHLWKNWRTTSAPSVTEHWLPTGASAISAYNEQGKLIYTEKASISEQQDQLVYTITHPTTQQPTQYRLTPNSTPYNLVFTNSTAPYPSVITYRFTYPATLTVSFSGTENGHTKQQQYTLQPTN